MKEVNTLKGIMRKVLLTRNEIYQQYYNKYYNLYMNRYDIENVDFEQKDYILRKLWADGTIATFKLEYSDTNEHPQGVLVFCPYSVNGFNIYDFPVQVICVNTRGVKFIPAIPMDVNKNIVLGWAQRNHKSIHFVVDYYCKKITNAELVLQMNLIAQKAPWLIASSPENKRKLEEYWKTFLDDNPSLFIDLEDADKAKPLISGVPYIIDKLTNYINECENKLREFFGFDNVGVGEKKEHLISDEVEANNEVVDYSGICLYDCLTEFSERVKNVLGYDMPIVLRDNPSKNEENETEEDLENEE